MYKVTSECVFVKKYFTQNTLNPPNSTKTLKVIKHMKAEIQYFTIRLLISMFIS